MIARPHSMLGQAGMLALQSLAALLLVSAAFSQARDYTRWVNPFIGTGGHGHTFPGATVPFGMVQLSPDTRIDNWDGSSGYHYSDDIIYGFSHTHLSGTGIPDGCDILFMPTVGEPQFFAKDGDKSANGYASKFSHANEKAEPGYYSVKLEDDGILAEITATARVGLHRYTFPASDQANILLDLKWRDKATEIRYEIEGDRVEGYRRSSSWAKDQKVYFVAEFSKPVMSAKFAGKGLNGSALNGMRVTLDGETPQLAVRYQTKPGEQIMVKVAISYVSVEGARKNLEAELPHWNFDKVRADAKKAWNKELSKIEVSGGTDEQTTNFYTALYHTMIHPNVFNDVDGRYKGHDGKVHQLRSADTPVRMSVASTRTGAERAGASAGNEGLAGGTGDADRSVHAPAGHYTVFSLWDTFRAAHPLYTITDQKRTVDFINTFLRIYDQGGRLPVWELWGEETDTMIGYHAVSVIADAMSKGIEGFDYEKAYKAAKHSANLDHFGLAAYRKRGYISGEDENESVSKTLEYSYNDYNIATMALSLMQAKLKEPAKYKHLSDDELDKEAHEYFARSLYYRNLFDPETKFFRPKRNGGFVAPFAPNEVTFHFTEGNSWQYSFFVPHDVSALAELHGGKIRFAKKLDELFSTEQKLTGREQPDITGLIGQYAHGNEPSHHIAYLYNYVHEPWKTQALTRRIMDEFYKNAPDGLIGNEDCGQMSAWYVMSSLGFYQVNPSRPVYDLGTPLFKEAKVRLESGKAFTVKAPNVSQANKYVKSIKLNGKPHKATYFRHEDITNGGTFEFEMTDTPVTDWFDNFSLSEVGGKFVPVPTIDGPRVFKEEATISIRPAREGDRITYTIEPYDDDGGRKTFEYTGPFKIDGTVQVEAFSTHPDWGTESKRVSALFKRRTNDWSVKLLAEYNSQYPGNGEETVIDGLRGNSNFAAGEWQGYQGRTFEAVVDLRRETEIKRVGGSFLQSAGSWIWMPDRLEFEISNDGVSFAKVADWRPGFPQTEMKGTTKEFIQTIDPVKARYVRVRAHNFGKIPSWHPGAGGDPWIFIDELFVE